MDHISTTTGNILAVLKAFLGTFVYTYPFRFQLHVIPSNVLLTYSAEANITEDQ